MRVLNLHKKIISLFLLIMVSGFLFAQTLYWENPQVITDTDSRFPVSLTNGQDSYILWEEVDSKNKAIYLSIRKYNSFTDFFENRRFAGPFNYSGDEVPDIYTAAILDDGRFAVAVASDYGQISVFSSSDQAFTFEETKLPSTSTMVAPRIYSTKAGGYKMFTSVGEENAFTIFTADSSDGKSWSRFVQFQPVQSFRNPFIPVLLKTETEDILVFQAQYTSAETNRLSYQLYLTSRSGNGINWTAPVLLTDRNSLTSQSRKEFHNYQNQRPYLFNYKGTYYLTWERTDTVESSIWVAQITKQGLVKGTAESIGSQGSANRSILFEYEDHLYTTWFDTRRGRESVYMARKNGSYWEETSLVENRNSNMFACPLITKDVEGNQILSFIWQQTTPNNKNSIAILSPDKSVNAPTLNPLSYKKGKASRSENVQIRIDFPEDSSNIAGYSYTWSRDSAKEPPKQIEHFTRENKIKTKATEDGYYYLTARIVDYAGNWSEPVSLEYHLDLTPPQAPEINIENIDKYGFINSNNYSLQWKPSASEDTEGYVYRIDHIADIPKSIAVSKKHPMKLSDERVEEIKRNLESRYENELSKNRRMSANVQTKGLSTPRYYNKPNGLYLLSVAAIDEVGNLGPVSSQFFILNKFQPSTYITSVTQKQDDLGNIILTISGGGFTYDGTISKIYIDKDGKQPYELTLDKNENKYRVQSNTKITNVNLGVDLEEGSYRIGLYHTDRGLYFTERILKVAQNGTLKIEAEYQTQSKLNANFKQYKYQIAISLIIGFLILCVLVFLLIFASTTLIQNIYTKQLTTKEINALLEGAAMPLSKTGKDMNRKQKRLPSLKRKLIRFTYSLVVMIVLAVTIEDGFRVIRLQEATMAAGLANRTEVLLESLFSGVKNFFPANNLLELTALPGQKEAMDEVKYVTIIGQKMDSTSAQELNYIWATNDPEISLKMDTYTLIYGESNITDDVVTKITKELAQLDQVIKADLQELSDRIEELSQQATVLYASGLEEDTKEADRLSDIIVDLRNQVDAKLEEYSKNAAGSYPNFDTANLDHSNTDFIFYRPVMYRKGTSGNYIHGLVYLELSTQTLIESLNREIRSILFFGAIVAILAVFFGVFGSLIFASLIVRPIKKLEAHVIMIGQTKNKALLKGKDVEIKTKDEVGRLGDAVNNMTHELVANAEEEALAMDGKAVQKAFLPLASGALNNKNTYAEYNGEQLQCYGYYEGESGVSGDYFDYKKLDEQWFGIIKCDASGHGIPAAIIMTVVATIFRRYFENWSFNKNGTKLNVLVEQINDFIEGLGLKGKFATLIICLLNVKTGELYMCNAGDNLVHIYEASKKKMKLITLASAPTAGVFTSDLVAMRGGFKVEKTILNKGDILFLYTDGIEESTRRIREFDYTVRQNDVEVRKMNPKTHQEEVEIKTEDAKEEFGPERVSEIIESVYNRQKYVLTKVDNPDSNETLEFDFTTCEGTVREAILALASMEKVFRFYKSPSVQNTDYVKVDRQIDDFLSKYFNRYEFYAAKKSDNAENGINYIDYDQMQEDEQSDDLTLLAIKRI